MKFVWTDHGDDPSWGVGDRHGIDGYFAPLFDPLTPSVLDETIRRGHAHGVYLGHAWLPGLTAEQVAQRVAQEYRLLSSTRKRLRVMLNLEEHNPDFVADVLEEWRERYPFVATSWSCEGMQGGWMSPEFVQRVLACRVRVVPQTFWGDMRPIAEDQVLRDLLRRGFPENIVSLFYDGARLEDRWDGYCFTAGRLPA
jgi:hypothetical protein